MNNILLGFICGFVFGALDAIIMIPMPEKDKRKKYEAILGAFIERFMIGFLIPNTTLGSNFIFSGLIIGLGFSLPTAIITRVYIPIITIGIIGGAIIGFISNSVLL